MIHSKAHPVPSILAVPLYIHVYTFFIAMDCDSLTDPTNGQVSHSRTTLGQTATYSCNTGYNLMVTVLACVKLWGGLGVPLPVKVCCPCVHVCTVGQTFGSFHQSM